MDNSKIQAFLNGLAKLSQDTGIVLLDGGEGILLGPVNGSNGGEDGFTVAAQQPVQYGYLEPWGYVNYRESDPRPEVQKCYDEAWEKNTIKSDTR